MEYFLPQPVARPLTSPKRTEANPKQNLVRDFKGVGFKPEVKPLALFQDDYGLKVGDAVEEEDDEDAEVDDSEKDDMTDDTED